MKLIFIDCEAYGGCPRTGQLTEFGAVEYLSREKFYGIIQPSKPSKLNPAIPEPTDPFDPEREAQVFRNFYIWLKAFDDRCVAVSDNPAYDWQWINDGLHRICKDNPLGFSARRIGDFYAGLKGDWHAHTKWKHLRRTVHDHNPVNDAMGNVEAFEAMISEDLKRKLNR